MNAKTKEAHYINSYYERKFESKNISNRYRIFSTVTIAQAIITSLQKEKKEFSNLDGCERVLYQVYENLKT